MDSPFVRDFARISGDIAPIIKKFLIENKETLKQLSNLSYLFLIFRCIVLFFAFFEFRFRDQGIKKAKSSVDVEREHKRWVLKFGHNNGVFDIINGIVFSIMFTLIMKLITPTLLTVALDD